MSEDDSLQELYGVPPTQNRVSFDLQTTLSAVVSLHTRIPESALTAAVLGTERSGHGVQIGDGLVVTIGYIVAEADEVWLMNASGRFVQGYVAGYDAETGFGLVKSLAPLDVPVVELGSAAELFVADTVVVAGAGGVQQAIMAQVTTKSEFAGYWEYVLDEAIFTAPAHPSWGGAALIGLDGRLCGIGSLLVQHAAMNGETTDGNMMVPIDLLVPIIDDLLEFGSQRKPPRPWLGWFVHDIGADLTVAGLYREGPADRSGVRAGDEIVEVNGEPVGDLASLFRRIWALGEAGVLVPLTIMRDGEMVLIAVQSADRNQQQRQSVRVH